MKKYTRIEMKACMEVRGYSPQTITVYINHIYNLAAFFNKAPHTLSPEHIHKYQVFLVQEKQISWSFLNQAVCAIDRYKSIATSDQKNIFVTNSGFFVKASNFSFVRFFISSRVFA